MHNATHVVYIPEYTTPIDAPGLYRRHAQSANIPELYEKMRKFCNGRNVVLVTPQAKNPELDIINIFVGTAEPDKVAQYMTIRRGKHRNSCGGESKIVPLVTTSL